MDICGHLFSSRFTKALQARLYGGLALPDVALDVAAETATCTFAPPLAAGPHRLRIAFTARINKFDRGFFLVD